MKKKLEIAGTLNDAAQTDAYSQFEADPDHPIRPDHESPRAIKDLRHVDPASVFEKRKHELAPLSTGHSGITMEA